MIESNPHRTKVGESLRRLRKEVGLTMGDVARALGVEVIFVSDVERDRVRIGTETVRQWCRVLAHTMKEQRP